MKTQKESTPYSSSQCKPTTISLIQLILLWFLFRFFSEFKITTEKNVKFLSSLLPFECRNTFYLKWKECLRIHTGFFCLCIVPFDRSFFSLFFFGNRLQFQLKNEIILHSLHWRNQPPNSWRLITPTSPRVPRMDLLVVERVAQRQYIEHTQ